MAPPAPDQSSLLDHLDTLYPLACMLAGRDAAPDLLQRTAEDALRGPASEAPSDLGDWATRLVRTYESDVSSSVREDSPSAVPDSMRTEAAQRAVREVLPTALAACSPQERFLIALDLIGTENDAPTTVTTLEPSEAHATLRTEIKALLSPREVDLVEEALPEDTVRAETKKLLSERYTSVPGALRTRLEDALEPAALPSDAESNSSRSNPSLLDRLPARPTPRGLLFLLLLGGLVLGGGLAVSHLGPTSYPAPSSAPPSLTAFSAQHSGAVTSEFETRSRMKAAAYVDSVWNRSLSVPSIDGAPLRGIGRLPLGEDAEVPVLLYGGDTTQITTFAYSYALVQQIENIVSLSGDLRSALAKNRNFVVEPAASAPVLLWRDRDDIFVTVAPNLPADSLRSRIRLSR